jgi:hypothetical protein
MHYCSLGSAVQRLLFVVVLTTITLAVPIACQQWQEKDSSVTALSVVVGDDSHHGTTTTNTMTTAAATAATASTCTAGYVECVDGILKSSFSTGVLVFCETACNGQCCVGEYSCSYFTGKICKDGSCNGKESCFDATIPEVVKSCTGLLSCAYIVRTAPLVDSCNGDTACFCSGGPCTPLVRMAAYHFVS